MHHFHSSPIHCSATCSKHLGKPQTLVWSTYQLEKITSTTFTTLTTHKTWYEHIGHIGCTNNFNRGLPENDWYHPKHGVAGCGDWRHFCISKLENYTDTDISQTQKWSTIRLHHKESWDACIHIGRRCSFHLHQAAPSRFAKRNSGGSDFLLITD